VIPGTAALTEALIDLVAGVTAAPIGDGRPPVAGDPPYAIVYPIAAGGDTWGPDYVAPQVGASIDYQITSVAVHRADVEAFADAVRHAVLDRDGNGAFVNPMTVPGLVILDRELVAFGGVDEDRGVFNTPDQYRIHVVLA